MPTTAVFTKEPNQSLGVSIDLTSLLSVGEFVSSAVLDGGVSPTSPNPLVVTVGTVTPSSTAVPAVLAGGDDNLTYGFNLEVVTSLGRTINSVVAVLVKLDLNVPFATKNPLAFQSLVGEIAAGDAAIGKAVFILPANSNPVHSHVQWSLLDSVGRSLANGNGFDFTIQSDTFATIVSANAVIHVPSYTPETMVDDKFQIRWELHAPGADPVLMFESISVIPVSTVPIGAADQVELKGDPVTLSFVSPELFDSVSVDIHYRNTLVASLPVTEKPVRVSSGWYYQLVINSTGMLASVDPYSVSWKYWNAQAPNSVYRQTARLFVVNPSITVAIEDIRMRVSKARTTLNGQPDILFDTTTIMAWLRRGRDEFNGAGQFWTTFDMTDATGGVREFWLTYSEIAMLQAQALAEGEKAFNFSGQAISLEIDHTAHYQTLADTLKARVDQDIRPYKVSLKMGGTSGGTGNVDSGPGRNIPKLGITITPVSHVGRFGGVRYPY